MGSTLPSLGCLWVTSPLASPKIGRLVVMTVGATLFVVGIGGLFWAVDTHKAAANVFGVLMLIGIAVMGLYH